MGDFCLSDSRLHLLLTLNPWGRARNRRVPGRFDRPTLHRDMRDVFRTAQHIPTSAVGPRLSAREIDVLRAISRGASNKQVARALAMSPSTVRTHVEKAFRKLECSTRAAATLKASALGLL